ncbi:MAG: hypothetical protein KF753_08915 [Caldilineaceae bacterium]|nr:hypothetical protein [Caldilineaceae bacterium]
MQKNRFGITSIHLFGVVLAALLLSGCRNHYQSPHMGHNPPLRLTLAPTLTPTLDATAVVTSTDTLADLPQKTPTASPSALPAAMQEETATKTPMPSPTATATPATVSSATVTPTPARAKATHTPTPRPTPVVVIPNGFTKQVDETRGYSLAFPSGYTKLDLRSAQFRNLANAAGMGGQMATLNEFLDSPAGQSVGILAASDLAGMIFGGLPTIAQVMVVDAKGASQDTAQVSVEALLSGQGGFLSDPVIQSMENVTINNLPGVRATVTGNLAGANRPMAGKVVGLLANDKFFVLIQLTQASKLAAKDPIFDQIIGTFRPE